MSALRGNSAVWCLGVATVLTAVAFSDAASARPSAEAEYQFTQRQLEKAKARVAELEARLAQLEQARGSISNPLVDAKPRSSPSCEQPFVFDSSGIKRWLDECSVDVALTASDAAASSSCAEPFRVDRDGIKRVHPECVTQFSSDRYSP